MFFYAPRHPPAHSVRSLCKYYFEVVFRRSHLAPDPPWYYITLEAITQEKSVFQETERTHYSRALRALVTSTFLMYLALCKYFFDIFGPPTGKKVTIQTSPKKYPINA